jgi:hypothetical protein
MLVILLFIRWEEVARAPGETCAIIDQRIHRRGRTHILRLPPGRVVTFTNLGDPVQLEQECTDDVHEPAVVKHPLLSTTLWRFLLLLLFDLGGL